MAYEQMVQVSISLETSPISRASFGTPLFIGAHNFFTDRIRVYQSISAVGEDFPTTSNEYKAANSAFSQDATPSTIKIGRVETDLVTLTPDAVTAVGQVYSVSVTGTDDVTINATFTTTTGSETATDIVTDLTADLSAIVGVTVGGTTTLTLAKSGTDPFAIGIPTRLVPTYTTSETGEASIVAIEQVDNDWYFLAAEDHTEAYVLAMATAIEARDKLYFTSVAEAGALLASVEPATETLGKLVEGGYLRTSGWFHDEADDIFPEMAYIAVGSVFDPGKGVWANNRVEGAGGAARDPGTGISLTTTQKNNLNARRAGFVEITAGQNVTSSQSGKVAGNEWVDVIRNRDFLQARITEQYQFYMINQPVIPYTQSGIDATESVLSSELSKYVGTDKTPNILRDIDPFTINFPRAEDVDALTKATRIFTGAFDAFLSGAIQIVKITGTLSL